MIKVCCDPYHRGGRSNFGDILSLLIVERLSGIKTRPVSLREVIHSHIVCGGSILEYIPEDYRGFIWGTGFMFDIDSPHHNQKWYYYGHNFSLRKNFKKGKVLALRGELTKKRVSQRSGNNVELGDPGILSHLLVSKDVKVEYEVGVVPHYIDQKEESCLSLLKENKNWLFIDVMDNVQLVVDKIASCKNIISSSLHGIIVADSLGIPSTWKEFSKNVAGEGFKFRDYYTSVVGDMEERKRRLIEASPFRKK